MPRVLDYGATWADTKALLGAHKDGLTAIAGLMVFVPTWIQGMVMANLERDLAGTRSGAAVWIKIGDHFSEYWYIYLPIIVISLIGSASMYALLLRKDLPRIGDAVMAGLAVAPFLFLTVLLANLATFAATLAFIIPGLYIFARLLPTGAALVAQPSLGPIGAISHAWQLTRDNGWSVFGLVFVVGLLAGISIIVFQIITNVLILLAAGPDGIPLLQTGISALVNSLLVVLMMALRVAIYQQLTAQQA